MLFTHLVLTSTSTLPLHELSLPPNAMLQADRLTDWCFKMLICSFLTNSYRPEQEAGSPTLRLSPHAKCSTGTVTSHEQQIATDRNIDLSRHEARKFTWSCSRLLTASWVKQPLQVLSYCSIVFQALMLEILLEASLLEHRGCRWEGNI